MSYYNTTGLNGNQLEIEIKNAESQEEEIYTLLQSRPNHEYTPWEILKMLRWPVYRITSLRRALNTLTDKNLLEKTDTMRKGIANKLNHTWRLKTNHV